MENGTHRWSSMLYLFLAGGVAGVGVGLLLAPQSGKDTRDTVRRKLHDTGRLARDLRERVTRESDRLREQAARRLTKAAAALSSNGRDGQESRAASA